MTEKKNLLTQPQENVVVCTFDLGNGEFRREVTGDQKFRSLIVDVDEHRGVALGLCPSLMMLPWSYSPFEFDTTNIVSGREATAILLEESAKQGVELGAAQFCHNYSGFGVEKGMAFLPTHFELARVAAHGKRLEDMLIMIGYNKCDHTFWSSSVGEGNFVWMRSLAKHAVSSWQGQMRTFGVMPMIEIKL